MYVYLFLSITLLLYVYSLMLLRRPSRHSRMQGWPAFTLSAAIAAFIYLYGAWVFLSIYLKYAAVALWLGLFIYSFIKSGHAAGGGRAHRPAANVAFAMVFLLLCLLYFTGTTGRPYGIARLKLPFRRGTYFVFQGGKGLPTNIFHYSRRGAVFAMDIIRLNKWGNRANSIFSTRLEDYDTFDDTLYSPCSGRVVKTENDNPDNIPPDHPPGPTNSNCVLIETADSYVFMGHMRRGSVTVHAGDSVITGQPVGCAGNSGYTIEPHLHIQAHAKTDKAIPWYREPQLLIEFDGKYYRLFETIPAP